MFFIYSFVLSRYFFQLQSNQRRYSIPYSFGFQSGGTYTIDIKKNESDNFIFLIAEDKDMKEFMEEQNLYHPCNVTVPINYTNITQIPNDNYTFYGLIEKAGMYKTAVLSCEYFHDNLSFTLIYRNPNSCLSSNVQKLLITNPIITAISVILLILWMFNWIRNFSLKNTNHAMLTASFIFYVVHKIFFLLETIDKNKNDFYCKFEFKRQFFHILHFTYMLTAFLSIHNQLFMNYYFKKYCIIALLVNFIVSFYLANVLLGMNFFDDSYNIDLHTFISILIWETVLVYDILLTIALCGGNMHLKFTLSLFLATIGYLLLYSVISIEYEFLLDYYIVFIIDIANLIFLAVFGYIFRMSDLSKNDYLRLQFNMDDELFAA